MKKNFLTRLKVKILISSILIIFGLFLGYKIFSKKSVTPESWQLSQDSNDFKFLSEENIINEMKNANKIIPLEIDVTHSIVIDDSFGSWEVFKKAKKINYYVSCSYAVDLSNIVSNDIKINKETNTIDISLPKPFVYSISIDEDKTVYEAPTLGLLRFGDISLSPEEYGVIKKTINKSLEEKLNSPDIYDKAVENSIACLKSLFSQVISKDTVINVTFKE